MAQFGPHRFDAGEYTSVHTDEYRGATFEVRDLTGARFVDCDLTNVKIIDGVIGMDMSGWVDRLVVNGIDVTEFVEQELDRRHPERVQLREMRSADDFRAMWRRLEDLWGALTQRAGNLTDAQRAQRVDGEWSFVETLRHLVFITDSWTSRSVRDVAMPYHRVALPQTAYPSEQARELGMEIDAEPTYAEVLEARRDRQGVVRAIVDELDDVGLGRMTTRDPAPGYPSGERPVWECLSVVLEEECEHYRFALRDLAALENSTRPGGT